MQNKFINSKDIVILAKAGIQSNKYLQYYVYIMTNKLNGTIYIGVTSDLVRRVTQHKEGKIRGFTQKYGLGKLVYYEVTDDIISAISREKQLKKWRRGWKLELIESANPDWSDLYLSLVG